MSHSLSSMDYIDDTDDDPIISTMPVYLSHSLAPHLYLLQSPLRPASRPYDTDFGSVSSVRVKPNQKRVEFEYRITNNDTDTDLDYNMSRSPTVTIPLTPALNSSHYDENTLNNIQSFKYTGRAVPCKTNYAVAIIRNHALHLTPLSNIVRMKPDLGYLDAAAAEQEKLFESARLENERERKALLEEEEDEEWNQGQSIDGDEKKDEPNKMRQLTIKYKKKESEKSQTFREKSYNHIKQLEESEPWVKLAKIDKRDEKSQRIQQRLYDGERSGGGSIGHLSNQSYFHHINASISENPLSHSLSERLLSFLRSARTAPFTVICDKLLANNNSVSSRQELLTLCERFAFYVQGAFVLKSVYVFDRSLTSATPLDTAVKSEAGGHSTATSHHGKRATSRDEICRDYLLTQFYHNRIVDREKVASMIRLPIETSRERLTELSTQLPLHQGWEWRWPDNDGERKLIESVKSYQPMINSQRQLMKEMETRTKWALQLQNATPPAHLSSLASHSQSLVSPSLSLLSSSAQSASSAHGESIQLLNNEFRQHGVCSKSYLLQCFHTQQLQSGSSLTSITDDSFLSLLASSSLCITDELYIRKSLGNAHVDRYRSVIASLFAERSSVKKGDVERAIEDCFGEVIPDNLYRKVMKEFASFEKGIWQLKSGEPSSGTAAQQSASVG